MRWDAMSLADHRTSTASISPSPVKDIRRHTAVGKNAIDNFVNYFQGNLVSPNMPWLSLRYESDDLTEQDDMSGANEYLGKLQGAIASELSASNFYPEHRMATKDKYVSACSALLVVNDPDRNICVFNTLTPWNWWIDTDQYGEVDTLFYKKTMSLDKAYEMFGDKCPKWIKSALFDGNGDPYNQYHDFLLCIYPRKKIYSAGRSIFPKEKRFAVVWMYLSGGTSTKFTAKSEIIDESGSDYFPAIVGSWDRDGDNPYGTCPVIRNLSELKRMDALAYETMLSVQKINHPAYAGVASSLEGFSDDPGARNKVNSMDMIPQPIQNGQTIDGAVKLQETQESAVEKMFNNDLFNFLSRDENNKVYTATQVNAVKAEQLSLLSAVYGNFQKEIEKTIKLVIAIMAENGRLPKGAKSLLKAKGKIRVVIDSTMAQELRAYTNRDANIALLEQAMTLIQIAPEALKNYNFDEIARGIAIGLGVKHTVLKDKMVVAQEKLIEQQMQQAQMLQQAELTQSEIDRNEAGASNLNNAGGSNQYGRR